MPVRREATFKAARLREPASVGGDARLEGTAPPPGHWGGAVLSGQPMRPLGTEDAGPAGPDLGRSAADDPM